MTVDQGLIFIHGLESSGRGFKANLLRGIVPDILTPTFTGSLQERMAQLVPVLAQQSRWIIVGSSLGGLMGALFTCAQPQRVVKLILLAPALTRPEFASAPPAPVAVPVVVYHGLRDTVIPLAPTRALAGRVFPNLTFHEVDDDHMLRGTVQALDWLALLRA